MIQATEHEVLNNKSSTLSHYIETEDNYNLSMRSNNHEPYTEERSTFGPMPQTIQIESSFAFS